MGRTLLKWLAALGSGGLTTLVLWILVQIGLDLTSATGAALATLVGTLSVKVVTWAVSKTSTVTPVPVVPAAPPTVKRKTGRRV